MGGRRTNLLAGLADGHVILVGNNADLIHQSDLLLIMTGESFRAGVDIGEEPQHVLRCDRGLLRRGGGSGRHDGGKAELAWEKKARNTKTR